MKLFCVSVVHMEPEIAAMSLMRLKRTGGVEPDRTVIVSHHWPINPRNFDDCVHGLAGIFESTKIVRPEKNLGGHGGFTFGLEHIDFDDDDLILGYDPDSYPREWNWLRAMIDVMIADSTMGYVSLMSEWIQGNRDWRIEDIGGRRVAFHPVPDMFNVTIWRGKMLRQGMMAERENPWYGNVETAMARHAEFVGMRWGYMRDFLEDYCPIPHHPLYVEWKKRAGGARSYSGNFDEYVKEFGGRD